MIKIKFIFAFLVLTLNQGYGQESFLKLDSIVIKETLLTPTSYIYQTSCSESYDTVSITVLSNQVVKVRSCAMSLTNVSSLYDAFILDNTSEKILDARIEIDEFNVFSTSDLAPPSSSEDYRGSYSSYQLRTEGFAGFSKHDFLLNEGIHEAVFHFKGINLIPEVRGRLELIYYSFE